MTGKDLAPSRARARTNNALRHIFADRIGSFLAGSGLLSLLVALLLIGAANPARADEITNTYGTGTPVMSWEYSTVSNVGQLATYWTYYPFQPDYNNAVFQGYLSTPADGIWGPIYDPADQDTIFVFRTNVQSSVDQTISLSFGGDDNATAYVNGVFQDTSHIFTKSGLFDLSLTAGIPVSLVIAIYNSPDGWVLGLTRADGQNLLGNDSTITISAIPEPAGIFLLATVLSGLVLSAHRQLRPSNGRSMS